MSLENERLITAERSVEGSTKRVSSMVPLHGKREEVDMGFQTFDAEYHAAGFCACCLHGE